MFIPLFFHVLIFKLIVSVMNLGNRALEPKRGHSSALLCLSWHTILLCLYQWPVVNQGLSNSMSKPGDQRLDVPPLFDMVWFQLHILKRMELMQR